VTRLFALTIFLSATLLFMVQPLVGKILLPVLGGSPAVWSICMVFFQAVLLLGYFYAHLLSTRVPPRWQWAVHLGVLIVASLMLPLPIAIGEPAGDPTVWLIRTLAATAGLPFFALSATAPLIQKWFSRTTELKATDPYFLYAASNAGSLLGLLGYLLVEPVATRTIQVTAWAAAFWSVSALIAACAYMARTVSSAPKPKPNPKTRNREATPRTQHPAPGTRWLWILLSLVPSALLLGVTQHLATDVVSAPFVWVVPLALYLSTFIAAFSTRGFGTARRWGTVAPLLVLAIIVLSLAEVRYPIIAIAFAHLAAFIALAMLCHTRLAEARPDPSRLTEYFLCISLGGVLGGAVVALIAPLVFSSIHEYPLAIAAALLLRPQTALADRAPRSSSTRWLWRAAAIVAFAGAYWSVSTFDDSGPIVRVLFAVPAVVLLVTHKTAMLFAGAAAGLLVAAGNVRTGGDVVHRERTFFGVHEVTFQQGGDWHVLTHGTTTHGIQAFRGKVRSLPTTYYHPTGPIGDVVFALSADGRLRDVAVVGLGAGSLAGYAGNRVRMDFFEVDEAVIRIAENPQYFTYLSDARARPGVTLNTNAIDGRLGLRAMPASSYDLIVIDAFSSDAIPAHLVTREAIALFASRLKPRGVMAFHVSSRFFNLGPVLARIAEDQGLVSYIRNDKDVPPDRLAEAKRPSVWVALARSDNDLGQIPRSAPRWVRLSAERAPLWTDDYTNVLGALED
jgi:spermidine synthase